MPYLLDTDIYIYLGDGNKRILEKIEQAGDENIFISAISIAELYYGAFNSSKIEENLFTIQKNLEKLQLVNFNKHTAKIFGRLKADLRKKGTPIDDMDLAIASISIHHGCTLVTHNTKHFSVIPELLIEDWS